MRRSTLRTLVTAIACCAPLAVRGADDGQAFGRKPTHIPAEPLDRALQQLANDRDLQVAYAADDVASIITGGASGELTVDEALTQLLRDTGLVYRHSGINGISIARAGSGGARSERHSTNHGHEMPTTSRALAEAKAGRALAQPTALQEIVITAQRRRENLQRVPIAATALQGSDLAGRAVVQLNDLQHASPSLSIGNAGLSNAVNIRGVGLASGSPAVANGVALYVDGLFQTPTVYTNQLYDIADVEILRGPQGTLVGANSTGGAIFVTSRSPQLGERGGYFEVDAGSYDAWSAQGAVSLPVSPVLALRVAGELTAHRSYYESIGPAHTSAGSLHEKGIRLGVLFEPGALRALGKMEWVDRNTGGYAATAVPGSKYAPYAPADPFVLDYDTPDNLNHERETTLNLELRYELANGITLRSQSGYIDKPIHNFEDYDGTSVDTPATPRLTYDQRVRGRQWTQEINVLSPQEGLYDWVAGAYLARNHIDVNIYETGTTGAGGPTQYLYSPQKKTTTGWFGQLNFKLAPQWELQTGVRYSTYRASSTGFISLELPSGMCGREAPPPAPWNGCQIGSTAGEETDGRASGKVALDYALDEDTLFYAFIARGYKPGGFNSPNAHFDPETVWDYEIGWKATLLEHHARMQLGGFHYRYQSFQFQELDRSSGSVGVTNLPAATIGGIEASLQARAAGWAVDAGLAYVHSKLPSPQAFVNNHLLPPSAGNLSQCPAGEASSAICFDYTPYLTTATSGPTLYSPQWTGNLAIQYELRLARAVSLTPRLTYAYVGGQFTSLTYSRVTDYLPAHGLLAASLALRMPEHWALDLYGDNLTNEVYRTGEGLNSGNYYFYGAPRRYGIRATYGF